MGQIQKPKEKAMANRKFWLGVLVIVLALGMAVVGCSKGSTGGGGFTLTDIPSQYNGKYALLVGVNIASPNLAYVGYQSFDGKDKNKLCRISNGRVSIPMWTFDKSSKINRYSGSDTLYMVSVNIFDSETQAKEKPEEPVGVGVFMTVAFSNGNAAKSWDDGMATGGNPIFDAIFENLEGILGNMGAGR
jgi:hypothetical protein